MKNFTDLLILFDCYCFLVLIKSMEDAFQVEYTNLH